MWKNRLAAREADTWIINAIINK